MRLLALSLSVLFSFNSVFACSPPHIPFVPDDQLVEFCTSSLEDTYAFIKYDKLGVCPA